MLICVQIYNKRSIQHETQKQAASSKHAPVAELYESELDQVVGGSVGDDIGIAMHGKNKLNGGPVNSVPTSDSKVVLGPGGSGW